MTEAARDELRDEKPDEMSWSEFLLQLSGNWDGETSNGTPSDIDGQLDRIEASVATAEERTGDIQRTLEDLQR